MVIERINFLLDIVDFGQRPEPRSSNTSFGLSNSNPGRVDVIALARKVLTSRRDSLFID
jgi:hypothetical protein